MAVRHFQTIYIVGVTRKSTKTRKEYKKKSSYKKFFSMCVLDYLCWHKENTKK